MLILLVPSGTQAERTVHLKDRAKRPATQRGIDDLPDTKGQMGESYDFLLFRPPFGNDHQANEEDYLSTQFAVTLFCLAIFT
jgi:hypothetical protein